MAHLDTFAHIAQCTFRYLTKNGFTGSVEALGKLTGVKIMCVRRQAWVHTVCEHRLNEAGAFTWVINVVVMSVCPC